MEHLLNKGRFYTKKNNIESNALNALYKYSIDPAIIKMAIFTDIHYCSEKSLPVGVSFLSTDYFYPLITGKDMGCGVAFLRIKKSSLLKPFNKDKHYRAFDKESMKMTDEGLGGGNHFLSLEESDNDFYIIVHTGSRNLGIYMYQSNYEMSKLYGDGFGKIPIEYATEKYKKEYNSVLNYATKRREEFLLKTLEFLEKNSYVNKGTKYEIFDSVHNHLEFTESGVIHRKGSTSLSENSEVVIPLSMSRGSLIVKPNKWSPDFEDSLASCCHGAGRQYSRTDTLKHWHSLKKSEKESFKEKFPELLEKNGEFPSSIIQEFDFAYKNSDDIFKYQSYLIKVAETKPIATVKFTSI